MPDILWDYQPEISADPEYPDIKKAYYLSMRLGLIYHQCRHKDTALTRLARWYDEVDKSGSLAFGRVARSIQAHFSTTNVNLSITNINFKKTKKRSDIYRTSFYERKTRLELATPTLARLCSTN